MKHLGILAARPHCPARLLVWGVAAALLLAAVIHQADLSDLAQQFVTPEDLADLISGAGPWAVVLLLAFAVVATPIPSGAIAIASGTLYGTLAGGSLTLVGAIVGAMTAFGLSRRLGFRPLSASSLPAAVWLTKPRSQRMLMGQPG